MPDIDATFEPIPFQIVTEPKQLKAFADPLRNRILHLLAERAATNQQLATALGEPQAKVLHHVRSLLDSELIVLVEERIKGGNVEKYYRATARLYGIRAEPITESTLSAPVLEAVLQEVITSETLWPEQSHNWETRRNHLRPERVKEFSRRLNELLAEYWGGVDEGPVADDDGELMAFAAIMYRHPAGYTGEPVDANA